MSDIDQKDLEDNRREHFAVKIEPIESPAEPGEIYLLVTHNGYEWTAIRLAPIERLKVLHALMTEGL